MTNHSKNKSLVKRLEELKSNLPAVFVALKDEKTPLLAKSLAVVIVVYALSPIDFIPDFIPFLGYLDDLLILPLLIALLIKLIPNQVWQEAKTVSQGMWQNGKPKHWYYAIPIVIFWLVICLWIFKLVTS